MRLCTSYNLVCLAAHCTGERAGWQMAGGADPQQREGPGAAEPAELWRWA